MHASAIGKVLLAFSADPAAVVADLGERFPGVRTMAAPVTDPSGHPWAGPAIQGPTSRLTDERLPALVEALVSAASSMR